MFLNLLVYYLIVLFKIMLLSLSVSWGSGIVGSAIAGVVGVFTTWYAGIAVGSPLNPFFGLITVIASESHSLLQAKKDTQPGVSVPRSSVLVGILAGVITAAICLRTENRAVVSGVVNLLPAFGNILHGAIRPSVTFCTARYETLLFVAECR